MHVLSGIVTDILSGIMSDILSGIYSCTLPGIYSAFYITYLLTFFLSASGPVVGWLALGAVEVQRCPLHSGPLTLARSFRPS